MSRYEAGGHLWETKTQSDVWSRLQKTKTWWRAKWEGQNWADGSVCVFFLINTTMKVGCAEASGTLEQCLLATDHCYAPIHTTSILQCLMYLEKYLNELLAELWSKRQKKSIKCAYLAKGFSNELYICNYASVSQRALFVILEFGVWICGACLQLEQTAGQLIDDFWPINALFFFF